MLVISRKAGECVQVADDIQIHVIAVEGARVRLGIQAPKHIRILRSELDQSTIDSNNASVAKASDRTLLEKAAQAHKMGTQK